MTTHHAVLWIDHNEALALALAADGTTFEPLAHVHAHDMHTHPKKIAGHRHPPDARFLADVERLVTDCDEVVVFGPSQAKDDFVTHLEQTQSPARERIVSIGSLDRMTDGELAARAREAFVGVDQMRGVHVGR